MFRFLYLYSVLFLSYSPLLAFATESSDYSITMVLFEYPKQSKNRTGHAAIRISGNGQDILWEFTHGSELILGQGQGVLKLWTHWENSLKARVENGAIVKLYQFPSNKEQNEFAHQHFSALVRSSTRLKPETDLELNGELIRYKTKSNYHYLKNNCVTTAIAGFEAGTGILLATDNAGRNLQWYEKLVISLERWPNHTFLPKDLRYVFEHLAAKTRVWPLGQLKSML